MLIIMYMLNGRPIIKWFPCSLDLVSNLWLKQNFFDKKYFDCNYNPIYPKIFCRLRQFLVGVCVFVCVFVHVCVCACFNFQSEFDFFKSFYFFSSNLTKNGFKVENSEKYCRNNNQHPQDNLYANIQAKQTTSTFSAQICPKWILGFKFKKPMSLKESESSRYSACQFLAKMDTICANFQGKMTTLNFLA